MSIQYIYQGFTLIDITPTGIINGSDEFGRNQQRNWETVLQIIGLRTQPHVFATSNFLANIVDYNFGINYQGTHRIWTFKFSVEYADIYQEGADRFGLVKYDFKITPVILGLNETAVPEKPLFYPKGPWNNVYFKSLI